MSLRSHINDLNYPITGFLPDSANATFSGDNFRIDEISDPISPPTIARISSPGNVPNDDYVYVVAFETSTGDLTLPTGISNQISITDNTVAGQIRITNITQPTDSSIVFINLYRNGINIEGAQELVVKLSVGTTTYVDNLDTGSLPGVTAPTINNTGNLTVQGAINLQAVTAASGSFGTSGTPETTIDSTGISTAHLTASPIAQSQAILISPTGNASGTYTGDLLVLYNVTAHQILGTAKFDQNGSLVLGTLTNYAQNVIDGNIHIKALQPARTYGLKIDQGIDAYFGGNTEFASTGAAVPNSGTRYLIGQASTGTFYAYIPNGTTFQFVSGSTVNCQIGQQNNLILNQTARSGGGTSTLITATGAAHTSLAASTEATDVNLNLARQVQFAAGAIATQRAMRIQAPTYAFTGASTITTASTVSISGAPVAGTNATITNSYALNVEAGTTNLAGSLKSSGNVGFFGTTPTTQQVSAANLTNNVTSGGTSNQIDDWTNLTVYATDAAAIRNAVYQLSRKLKQVNDALRAYGLLT